MKLRKLVALLLALAFCAVLALPAMAAATTTQDTTPLDFETFGSLTISYTYTDENGNTHVLEDVEFRLYQVALLTEDFYLEKIAPFEDFYIPDYLFADQSLLIETCDSLEHYIDSNAFTPYEIVHTNGIGAVSVFLESGLYYIDAQLFWEDETTGEAVSAYYSTPFLVLIGAYDEAEDAYIYTYDAMPKISMMNLAWDDDEGYYTHSLTVHKEWENTAGTALPTEIKVQLYCDGCTDDEHTEIVTLNAANDWSYTWDALDASHTWAVREVSELEHYETSYALTVEGGQYAAVITNSYTPPPPTPTATPTATPTPTPPPPEELPQTGSNLPYIPIWAGVGIGLIALGVLLKKGGDGRCN